jgi:hypothetical protein
LLTAGLLLIACTGDHEGAEQDMGALPVTAPDGEWLCEFVPRDSVLATLGEDELSAEGSVHDPQGELALARCRVTLNGQGTSSLDVSVDWASGMTLESFDGGLSDQRYNQLPDEDGLGFSWTEQKDERPDGSSGPVGRAQLLRGDHVIDMWIGRPADGRDGEADAVAIAQQVVQTLELGDEWTLPGEPPRR